MSRHQELLHFKKDLKTIVLTGLELDVLTASHYFLFQKIFSDSILVDISMAIRMQRAVKSDYEIELMRQASQMADNGIESLTLFPDKITIL